MYYKPHFLQKLMLEPDLKDEFGRPVQIDSAESWVDVCECRCDHSGDKEVRLDDGTLARPEYRVICNCKSPQVRVGDHVRCVNADGSVRGEGNVVKMKTLNYLDYAEVYLQI